MEKSILLHCITPDELKHLIKEVIHEEIAVQTKNLNESDLLLSRTETCELLKINSTTLWNWTKKGKLPCYGIGNRVYYKKQEILKSLIRIN